jgi:hypothetical protein
VRRSMDEGAAGSFPAAPSLSHSFRLLQHYRDINRT